MQPDFGILTHNVVSMRGTPVGDSEQVSQALLGEVVEWLDERDGYVLVETEDAYRGWVWRKHLRPYILSASSTHFPLDEYPEDAHIVTALFADVNAAAESDTNAYSAGTKLVFGTCGRVVPDIQSKDGSVIIEIPHGTGLNGQAAETVRVSISAARVQRLPERRIDAVPVLDQIEACKLARRFLGVPYLWGGGTPFGFDCSGFVQRIYKTFGIILPRDAHLQAESRLGTKIDENEPNAPIAAGDLVFFSGQQDPRKRGITHVGMALNTNFFIHALGRDGVVITRFDAPDHRSRYVYRGAWRYCRT